jgi:hypothetical protein
MPSNKSLQRPPGGICRASCSGFYFCGQQARQRPGAAELRRYAALEMSCASPRDVSVCGYWRARRGSEGS